MELRIGFIRGLNVGGNNIVSMEILRNIFIELNYNNIETIGNTGVIIFRRIEKIDSFNDKILEDNLSDKIGIPIRIVTFSFKEIQKLIEQLPEWWNQNKDWRHNAIFLLDKYPVEKFNPIIDKLDEQVEKAIIIDNVVLWSSAFKERKLYNKSQYSKLVKNEIYPYMTIRNANTLNKAYLKAKALQYD